MVWTMGVRKGQVKLEITTDYQKKMNIIPAPHLITTWWINL